jgi:hypothetical protein
MGWQDDDGRHEGWAAAEWADGRLSAGSAAGGALVTGPDLDGADGVADGREAIGWRGVCECGWRGPLWRKVTGPAAADPAARRVHDSEPSRWGDPPPGVEDTIWREWNGHLPPRSLSAVRAAALSFSDARARLDQAFRQARAEGSTWDHIAAATATTSQDARRRWGQRPLR